MLPVIYSMSVSLDGFIAAPDGDIGWSPPDPELFGFHVDQTRHIAAYGGGRGIYLIDEYRQFVYPVVLGGGTPYFPPLAERLDLRLIESRTIGSRVIYLRYQRTR